MALRLSQGGVDQYRLYDRYRRPVASLAVLADEQDGWRPAEFSYELWGCRPGLIFPSVKLLDYQPQGSSLEASRNPFATVVLAHLAAQETRHDPAARQARKLRLTRRLYKQGYDRQQVLDLFGLVDWVLQLPGPQDLAFWREVQEMEEEKRMQYITSVERIGIQQGMQQGMQQGQAELVLRLLSRRFGELPPRLAAAVRRVPSEQMPDLLDVALTAGSLDEVAAAVEALAAAAGAGNGSQPSP